MLCGAGFGIFAVVPGFESFSGFIAVVIAIAYGTRVNQFLFTVDTIKLHDFFAWP